MMQSDAPSETANECEHVPQIVYPEPGLLSAPDPNLCSVPGPKFLAGPLPDLFLSWRQDAGFSVTEQSPL